MTCRVKVVDGAEHLSPPSETEEDMLGDQVEDGYRLACQTTASGDALVKVAPIEAPPGTAPLERTEPFVELPARGQVAFFLPARRQVEVGDRTLLRAAGDAGVPIQSVCGGQALCTTCRVKVVEGAENLTPPTDDEADILGDLVDHGYRLACQTRVTGPVAVHVEMPPPGADEPGHLVTFRPWGGQVRVTNESLLAAALRGGLRMRHDCGGQGQCRSCLVRVLHGDRNLSQVAGREIVLLGALVHDGYRLACQTRVTGDVVVEVMNPGYL
jgi:ferredoxin